MRSGEEIRQALVAFANRWRECGGSERSPDLKALHRTLDQAVAGCYGWPASVAQETDEIAGRLLQRNR